MKINFTGHLHIQNIQEKDGIYDISSGSILDYGNRYGRLDIYDNCYDYNAIKLTLPNVDLDKYSFDVFYNKYYAKKIKTSNDNYGEDGLEIADFASKINCFYFDGNYKEIIKLKKENRKLVKIITKANLDDYLLSLMNVDNKNQTNLLIKKIRLIIKEANYDNI